MKGKTDWDRLSREGDFEGEDEDDFEVDWSTARLVMPEAKKAVSLRIDPDVLDFFKSQGKGYQTRMNAVLRAYMEAKRAG
ncbi:MAG: BrnA antitoxin family protein [Paracoccus sp. (in: a-proteobacteria)]